MMNYALAVLGALLALSLAGNGYLWHERDQAIAAQATADQLNMDTRAAAATCTTSVEGLAKAGEIRDTRLGAQLAAIVPAVQAAKAESLVALRAQPDNPNDLCGSLLRFYQAKLAKEAP